jgi:HEAT repeat protein
MEPLIVALKNSHYSNVRVGAAEALSKIGDERAVEPLVAALKDEDGGVRKAVAEALGQIGDVRAVEPLIAALKDVGVRKAAVEALVEIGAPAVKLLSTVLRDKDPNVRTVAAKSLEAIGWRPDKNEVGAAYWIIKGRWDQCVEIGAPAVEPLMAALQDNWEVVRKAAAEALGKIGDARAVKPLLTTLRDKNSGVRSATVIALDQVGWQPDKSKTSAIYWIIKGEWDQCAEIGAPAVEPLMAALQDNWEVVRKAAAEALRKIGPPAVKPLTAALKHGNAAAAEVLGQIGPPAVEPLIAALKDKDKDIREAAAVVLEKIGDTRALEPLADYWIAEYQWDRCVEIGTSAVEPLIAALKGKSTDVHEAAAEALVEIGAPAVEPLIATLKYKNLEPPKRWSRCTVQASSTTKPNRPSLLNALPCNGWGTAM